MCCINNVYDLSHPFFREPSFVNENPCNSIVSYSHKLHCSMAGLNDGGRGYCKLLSLLNLTWHWHWNTELLGLPINWRICRHMCVLYRNSECNWWNKIPQRGKLFLWFSMFQVAAQHGSQLQASSFYQRGWRDWMFLLSFICSVHWQ